MNNKNEASKFNFMKKKGLIITASLLVCVTIICLVIFFIGKKSNKAVYELPSSEVKKNEKIINLPIFRYEEDIFKMDKNNLAEELKALDKRYPEFFIQTEFLNNPEAIQRFSDYLNDPVILDIYNCVMKQFPNLETFKKDFYAALARYYTLYPSDTLSGIITTVPGIDFETPSIFLYDNYLIINLDLYLGATDVHYKQIGIPKYISKRMDKKYMTIDCFNKALVYKHLPEKEPVTLLDNIINEGKKLYFTEVMNPNALKADIIGYDEKEMKWAEENYGKVWAYIIENNHLFSKEEEIIRRYAKEAPFTKPFENASPGRMGNYIGWLIINNYMNNSKNITIDELMKNTDSQYILQQSLFKPKK